MPASEARDMDEPLFEALGSGDEGALQELMQRHARLVRGVVFGVLGRSPEVDDVCQQVWIKVWRQAATLEDKRRWKSWLYRLAHNAAVDAGRKTTRRRKLWHGLTTLFSGESHTDDSGGRMQRSEVHERVLRAIAALPEIYRQPFVLRHLEDWSYKQIAEAMDMPVDTVETRLVRARRLLRESLGGRI